MQVAHLMALRIERTAKRPVLILQREIIPSGSLKQLWPWKGLRLSKLQNHWILNAQQNVALETPQNMGLLRIVAQKIPQNEGSSNIIALKTLQNMKF